MAVGNASTVPGPNGSTTPGAPNGGPTGAPTTGASNPGGVPTLGNSAPGGRPSNGTTTPGAPVGGTTAPAGANGGATAGIKPGSCAGFKNGTGITNSTITISNVADLSGPVPGLFKSAQAAVTAYVAYFNSTSSICGRKLKLIGLDSGTNESADQQADTTSCSAAFAEVGSLGAFDSGGANTAQQCGIPDLRTLSTEPGRVKSTVSYGVYSTVVSEIVRTPFEYIKTLGDAYKNAAYVYLNAGAAIIQHQSFATGETNALGFHFKDTIAIDVTSVPNYDGYVAQLKSDGIKYVQYIGAYQYASRLKAAMYGAGYNPIFLMDPVAYDAGYVAGGKAINGTYSFVPGPLFEEANRNPGLQTYLTWLQHTSGGAPTFFGVYAWCAAALFVQLAVELGGKLTRSTLLTAIRGVHNYTNNGMVPPQDPGGKHTTHCASVLQLVNGQWIRKTPYPYTCAATINTGVGT